MSACEPKCCLTPRSRVPFIPFKRRLKLRLQITSKRNMPQTLPIFVYIYIHTHIHLSCMYIQLYIYIHTSFCPKTLQHAFNTAPTPSPHATAQVPQAAHGEEQLLGVRGGAAHRRRGAARVAEAPPQAAERHLLATAGPAPNALRVPAGNPW